MADGSRTKSKLDWALDAAEYAFIFPLLPNSKKPAITDWPARATQDPVQIAQWWSENPDYNIGIACEPSNLFVIDADPGSTFNA